KYIKPGTAIMSDCWKAYSKLEQLCYKHGMVNHSVEFVNSDTVEHTQTIESTWCSVKASLPTYGTRKHLYKSYFAEYLFR
uniref:ISXO2-like transposase domain-containing protein n=1 Tax=Amphimedon queenslandica TaxID=400682 RepID=A0A1X7SWP1_AMPQE